MQPIHSGATRERVLRTGVIALLICGYAAWSLKDGYFTYPRKNLLSALRNNVGVEPPDPLPEMETAITPEVDHSIARNEPLEAVVARLGKPRYRRDANAYYFGPAGHLKIEIEAGRVVKHRWVDGPEHRASDLLWQKMFAFGLAPIGLAFVVQLVRVLRTRVVLSDAGLQIGNRPPIPLDSMSALRADEYDKKGWVDIECSSGGGRGTIRLDSYVVKEFRTIVTAICKTKDFPSPFD